MSRDYRKPSTARTRSRSQTKPRSQPKSRQSQKNSSGGRRYFSFVAGAAVGALLTALILVPQLRQDGAGLISSVNEVKSTQQSKRPQFDFYSLLGENEVVVREEPESVTKPRKVAPVKVSKPTAEFVYVLQVGSFRNEKDADSLRAKLLLMNFEANIDSIKSNSGAVWNRVIVGPFSTRGAMTQARDKLASNGIDVLLLKRPR